jgi:hypothetical protein
MCLWRRCLWPPTLPPAASTRDLFALLLWKITVTVRETSQILKSWPPTCMLAYLEWCTLLCITITWRCHFLGAATPYLPCRCTVPLPQATDGSSPGAGDYFHNMSSRLPTHYVSMHFSLAWSTPADTRPYPHPILFHNESPPSDGTGQDHPRHIAARANDSVVE